MPISKQDLKYHLTAFRTSKLYLGFQFFQLILSIVIIITALISHHLFRQPIVLYLQLLLLICMTTDLFIIKLMTEQKACKSRSNKIDWIIYLIFLGTFCFMSFTQSKMIKTHHETEQKYQILLEIDDIIVIILIVIRYGVQIYQMVKTIKDTQNNVDCQNNIKNFDLNKTPYTSVMEENNDVLQDQIIRQRIKSKNMQKSNISS